MESEGLWRYIIEALVVVAFYYFARKYLGTVENKLKFSQILSFAHAAVLFAEDLIESQFPGAKKGMEKLKIAIQKLIEISAEKNIKISSAEAELRVREAYQDSTLKH